MVALWIPWLQGCAGETWEPVVERGIEPAPFETIRQQILAIDSLYEAGNLTLMEGTFHRLLDNEDSWSKGLSAGEYAWTYESLSDNFSKLGDLENARKYSDLSMSRLDAVTDIDFKGHVWNNRAVIESDLGNFDHAIELLFNSMELYQADTVNHNFIDFYNNIGNVYAADNNFDLAIRYYEKLMELAGKLGLESEYGYYYGNLGHLFYRMGDMEKSVATLQKAKRYMAENGQRNEELALNALLASGYVALGRLPEAESLLTGSMEEAARKRLWETYVEATISLFELYVANGNQAAAFEVMGHGLEKVGITNTSRLKLKIYEKLISFYQENGDYESAYNNMLLHARLQDSLADASKSDMMHELTVKYETDRKNDHIAQLQALNDQEKKTNMMYLVGLVLLALIAGGIGWLLKRISMQKKTLEEINQTKDKLFSVIAHDLRSPMVALQGMGNLMNYYIGKNDHGKLVDLGNKTDQTLGRINHLLDNLLNWATTSRDQLTCRPVRRAVEELLDEALVMHQPAAEAKEIKWTVTVEPAAVIVDLNMASSILRNLISNAVKHAPAGSGMTITGQTEDTYYKIGIRDEGAGIQQQVLEQLKRKGDSLASDGGKESFGLGLRLAMSFVEKMSGKLAISNTGTGTLAEVYLPIKIQNQSG